MVPGRWPEEDLAGPPVRQQGLAVFGNPHLHWQAAPAHQAQEGLGFRRRLQHLAVAQRPAALHLGHFELEQACKAPPYKVRQGACAIDGACGCNIMVSVALLLCMLFDVCPMAQEAYTYTLNFVVVCA